MPQNPDAGPRRDDERDGQREKHRRARTNRNWPHVRSHQTADKRHRQNRGNHRKRGQDGRVADFADGFNRDVVPLPPFVGRQVEMADNVFDHDDGVVHEDADGKNQREERDAVQREAVEIKHQQSQRQRGRNRNGHDDGFAPAQREQNQQRHADHGDEHVPEQFVGFFLRRQAVISRDGHLHFGGNDAAFERVNFSQDFVGNGDGIRPRPLGNAQGDGGFFNVGQASSLFLTFGDFTGWIS